MDRSTEEEKINAKNKLSYERNAYSYDFEHNCVCSLIYKEESLFVCFFFTHSVPVRARAAKLCMAHP
jgi:hypothetical protein